MWKTGKNVLVENTSIGLKFAIKRFFLKFINSNMHRHIIKSICLLDDFFIKHLKQVTQIKKSLKFLSIFICPHLHKHRKLPETSRRVRFYDLWNVCNIIFGMLLFYHDRETNLSLQNTVMSLSMTMIWKGEEVFLKMPK